MCIRDSSKGIEFGELLDEVEAIVYSGTKLNIDYFLEEIMLSLIHIYSAPFNSAIALAAAASSSISMKANPLDLPVSRSITTLTDDTAP